MFLNHIKITVLVCCTTFLISCKKNDGQLDNTQKGNFSIEFQNIMGEETLRFNSYYKNKHNESFRVTTLNYFISNIKLKNEDGTTYIVPAEDSYFFIKGDDLSTRFTPVKIPEGNYTDLTFTLGVDSLRSTMNVEHRKGVLSFNPESGQDGGGMYWEWNSGYIFLKYEGDSPVISDDKMGDPTGNKRFRYHIGGFGGYKQPTLNNIKEIKIDLRKSGLAKVRVGYRSNVHLFVDISKIMNGGNFTFKIKENPSVMSIGPFSANVANNFVSMFTHDHTENFMN